jgi:hypothetical protein
VYWGMVQQCLISSPSDVPSEDLKIIHREITWWNGMFGRLFSTAITPMSWGTHAAAELGEPPQDILNRQLVDQCDMCIAVFARRLGTRTNKAESGTAEEIERLSDAGKYVAVLRCRRPVDLKESDINQFKKLEQYLRRIKDKALIIEYNDDAGLATQVHNILRISVDNIKGVSATEPA